MNQLVRIVRRPSSLFVLPILWLLLAAGPAQAAVALGVAPNHAPPGGTVRVVIDDAEPQPHELWLIGPTSIRLATIAPDAQGHFDQSMTLPGAAPGGYMLELRSRTVPVANAMLKLMPALDVTRPDNEAAQAGRYLKLSIDGIELPGLLTVSHQGRVLHGPVSTAPPGLALQVLLPADLAPQFPANVTLAVTLRAGGGVAQTGSISTNVTALPAGPFVRLLNASVDKPVVRSNERFTISGRITVDGGEVPEDMQFTAWWVGNSGQTLPLGGPPITMARNGQFQIRAYAPSLGSMGYADATGQGRIRLVGQRQSPYGTGSETAIVEGPNLQVSVDTDADIDINVRVLGKTGSQPEIPLEGAWVRLSGGAPLVDPQAQPATFHAVGLFEVSQVSQHLAFQPNQAGCEPTLNAIQTNANGNAEFVIEQASTIAGLQAVQPPAIGAVGVDCYDVPTNPGQTKRVCPGTDPNVVEYTLEVRARHLGYGRSDSVTGGEIPETFRITYKKLLDKFTIRNVRTGEVWEQTTSANILVRLNRSLLGNELIIGSPSVTGLRPRPPQDMLYGYQPPVDYVRLIDFGPAVATVNFTSSLQRRIEFRHIPDFDGGITSASLYLEGQKVGDFNTSGSNGYCPSIGNAQSQQWRLAFPPWLNEAMRRPGTRWPGRDKVCGTIEARNQNGSRSGSRRVCFHWAPPPSPLLRPGEYSVQEMGGADYQYVIQGNNALGSEQQSRMPNPGYSVGERRNRARRSHDLFQTYDDGTLRSDLSNVETEHRQFSRSPSAGAEPRADAAVGGSFGDQSWSVLLDQTFPLFRWYWGIPEIFGAEVFADLRVVAQKWFGGKFDAERAVREMVAKAKFQVFLTIGIDIDVLFGLLVDAGASITGYIGSEMGLEMRNGQVDQDKSGLFFLWGIFFSGWVEIGCPVSFPLDPTCWIPDLETTFVIAEGSEQVDGNRGYGGNLPDARDLRGPLTAQEQQAMFRHPALAFDDNGRGIAVALDAQQRLVATHLQGNMVVNAEVISEGLGIRNTTLAFLPNNHALLVWAESVLTPVQFAAAPGLGNSLEKVAAQRLHWAVWNGSQWSDKQRLWQTPGGDAHPAIAVCRSIACGRSNDAIVVFTHRHGGSLQQADMRTWWASYDRITGMSAPQLVDPSSTQRMEVSPTVAYQQQTPVVAFVRYGTRDITAVDTRQLAYRHFSSTSTRIATDLPSGLASPSLASHNGRLVLAFTRAEPDAGFASTRQALHFAEPQCNGSNCAFTWARMKDMHGRAIFGQKPEARFDAAGAPLVTLRALGFGEGDDGLSVRPGDPLGSATQTGDVVSLRIDLAQARFVAQAITNDAAGHFNLATALDPLSGNLFSLSSQMLQPGLLEMRETWQKMLGPKAGRSSPQALMSDGMVALNGVPVLPDPAVVSLSSEATRFVPGQNVTVRLTLANHGSDLSPVAAFGEVQLRFGAPTGIGTPQAVVPMPVLPAAGQQTLDVVVRVPTSLDPDLGHTLFATLVPLAGRQQADSANDSAWLRLGDLPVPTALHSETHGGTPFVRIGWDAVDDPRVVGYRIYAEDSPDVVAPLGASDVAGFLDLSAQYGSERTYYVSAFTARGTESARSVAVTVTPPKAQRNVLIFNDGLETR
ncbi:MAG: hypothetical protein WCZ65_06415 [Lysobacteraceae bacterium]